MSCLRRSEKGNLTDIRFVTQTDRDCYAFPNDTGWSGGIGVNEGCQMEELFESSGKRRRQHVEDPRKLSREILVSFAAGRTGKSFLDDIWRQKGQRKTDCKVCLLFVP